MLNEIVEVVSSPSKNKKGLRLVQRVYKEGFKEFVDIAHVEIEEFSQGATSYDTKKIELEKKSIEIDIVNIPKLIVALKSFSGLQRKKKLVRVELITDMSQYKNDNKVIKK